MYLDFSLKKIATLSGVILMLFSFVLVTHVGKMSVFGSTPYFYAISAGARYLAQTTVIGFAKFGKGMYAAAAGALRAPAAESSSENESPTPAIPVLTYHRVLENDDPNNVTIEVFRDQMETLHENGWRTVTLEEFEDFLAGNIQLPEKSFLLTFDDGAKDSFYPVDPILNELDYQAVMYIIVQSSKTSESTYYLTPEEIRMMLATGRWSIGSHSYDGHRPYGTDSLGETGIFFADRIWSRENSRLETPEEFTARVSGDLRSAREELEATYSRTINTLAFPLGNETGIEGANNFPEGASITEAEARKIYSLGFVQLNNQTYTFNFPAARTQLFSSHFSATLDTLKTNFLVHRIHVDHDWDGKRLLEIMENGRAKTLPYEDDFSQNKGWIPAWGALDSGRNNLQLHAEPENSSAGTFLDGSALWDNYTFDIAANWQSGYAVVAADVLNSKTYHACAFSEGAVLLQEIVDGHTRTLAEKQDPRIQFGDNVSLGIRVHDNVIECAWNFESLVESYERTFSGGIGLQAYNPTLGTATLQVTSVIARPASTR